MNLFVQGYLLKFKGAWNEVQESDLKLQPCLGVEWVLFPGVLH